MISYRVKVLAKCFGGQRNVQVQNQCGLVFVLKLWFVIENEWNIEVQKRFPYICKCGNILIQKKRVLGARTARKMSGRL